jgi:hypothetical protein
MKNKELLYQLLYFSCIGVTFLNNYELVFAVWAVTIFLTLQKKYSITLLKYVSFFIIILITAFISSLFRDHKIYGIIRDITYLAKPIMGLWAGYQLCKVSSEKALKMFIYTGAIISLIHLVIICTTIITFGTFSVNLIRQEAGYFSDYEIYVLIMLIFSDKFKIQFSKSRLRFLIILVGVSSFLYLARTNLIQFVVLFVALKGYFVLTKKSITVLFTILITVLLGYGAVYSSNPKRGGKGLETFLYKIKIAPIEPFKTKINKDDWKDFNDNYRSYENIIAVKQVSNQGLLAVFFGEGLGATLDLGREVFSNDGEFVRHIPIVHNGYMTVFLKSGIFGVFFLICFIVMLCKQESTNDDVIKHINYFLIGTGVFLIFSNWVFLGLYLKLDNKSVIIGFLIALRQVIDKENRINYLNEKQNENN